MLAILLLLLSPPATHSARGYFHFLHCETCFLACLLCLLGVTAVFIISFSLTLDSNVLVLQQPIYKDPEEEKRKFHIPKSESCPNLFMDGDDDDVDGGDQEAKIIPNIKHRERAFSECIKMKRQRKPTSVSSMTLNRVQSDSDLSNIDKEKTFAIDATRASMSVQPGELLAKVVVALGGFRNATSYVDDEYGSNSITAAMGIHGFSDSQILASEQNFHSDWSIGASEKSCVSLPPNIGMNRERKSRATSEIRIPIEESVKVCRRIHLI